MKRLVALAAAVSAAGLLAACGGSTIQGLAAAHTRVQDCSTAARGCEDDNLPAEVNVPTPADTSGPAGTLPGPTGAGAVITPAPAPPSTHPVRSSPPSKKSTPAPKPETTYNVASGGGISSVTYSTAGFNIAQDNAGIGNSLGTAWAKTLPDAGLQIPTISAQSAGSGTITCSIWVDGKQVVLNQSHGPYAVVTCTAPANY